MVGLAHHHEIRWLAPQPLWGPPPEALNGATGRPAILRFATDAFMEELLALTATRPEQLAAWLARPETWREPMPAPDTAGLAPLEPPSAARARLTRIARGRTPPIAMPVPLPPAAPLKLYQPAHGRFYLVTACLVCQLPGLPDRAVDGGKQEQVRFVLRRLVPPDGAATCDPDDPACLEHAFLPQGEAFAWQPIADLAERARLQPNEERLPLFPLTYRVGRGRDLGRRRRLFAGAIPVARREAYLGAPAAAATTGGGEDARRLLFQTEVVAPWLALIDQAAVTQGMILEDPSDEAEADAQRLLLSFRERAQTAGWFLLLDLARFLEAQLPRVWQALLGTPPTPALNAAEAAAAAALSSIRMSDELTDALGDSLPDWTVEPSLAAALALISAGDVPDALEATDRELDLDDPPGTGGWPEFLFLPAHPAVTVDPIAQNDAMAGPQPDLADAPDEAVAALSAVIAAALPATPAGPVPELAAPPAPLAAGDAWFTIRCVYERPNCTGFARPVVSRPSVAFQMASFFDPDAPARALRIAMPLDISPAALRKYKKGAGFVLSDLFCGQMQRFKRLTLGDLIRSVLPWPLHKDLPGGAATPCGAGGTPFGLFVSISIPIVTICAFILMIIMVALFDLIFRWLPYLIVAFPIPGLRGKQP